MDYKEKYNKLLDAIKELQEANPSDEGIQNWINDNVPELKESKDERIRKEIVQLISCMHEDDPRKERWLAWLEKQGESQDKGEISDGYHTFNELYYYRMLYNAAFFNLLPKEWVHKSKKHHDGKECFGGGWFIVMANLPTGQISNHYELKDWELFQIPEKDVADEWDGHTPKEAAERLHKYLLEKQGQGQVKESSILQHEGTHKNVSCKENDNSLTREPKFKVKDWVVYNYPNTLSPISEIIQIDEGIVELKDTNGSHFQTEIDELNCNYHLWNISDAKGGDVLCCESGWTCIFKALVSDENFSSYCFMDKTKWFYETESECHTLKEEFIKAYNGKIYPATKEQRDVLMKAMADAGYTFDFDNKKLKRKEKK